MKAVLLSIRPQWCELIASGEKTVEVRKNAPKLGMPFMVYMYQTKKRWIYKLLPWLQARQAKVIGEFVCDRVDKYDYAVIACAKFEVNGGEVEERKRYNAGACLSAEEMFEYSGGKTLYGWRISDLKIYEQPKMLGEFITPSGTGGVSGNHYLYHPAQSWCYVEELV